MDSELNSRLEETRSFSLEMLKLTYQESIPSELALPTSFWMSYSDKKLAIGLRACLAIWTVSGKKIVPNEFQLTATISLMSGQDTLVDVGTGYGKTLHDHTVSPGLSWIDFNCNITSQAIAGCSSVGIWTLWYILNAFRKWHTTLWTWYTICRGL